MERPPVGINLLTAALSAGFDLGRVQDVADKVREGCFTSVSLLDVSYLGVVAGIILFPDFVYIGRYQSEMYRRK
jgi:hypothetical protein